MVYIDYCPVPFHDLVEVAEFLCALSPQMATLFDGCRCTFPTMSIQFVMYIRSFSDMSPCWTYRRYLAHADASASAGEHEGASAPWYTPRGRACSPGAPQMVSAARAVYTPKKI